MHSGQQLGIVNSSRKKYFHHRYYSLGEKSDVINIAKLMPFSMCTQIEEFPEEGLL